LLTNKVFRKYILHTSLYVRSLGNGKLLFTLGKSVVHLRTSIFT